MVEYKINNIGIDKDEYEINEYIKLKKYDESTFIDIRDESSIESNCYLFFQAIKIAVPKVNLSLSYRKQLKDETEFGYYLRKYNMENFNTKMFNYYFQPNGKSIEGYELLDSNGIEKLKKVFDIVISYNKRTAEKQIEKDWKLDRYDIAYNHYLDANYQGGIENNIMNLITVLECLLVKGTGELNFRTSLYTSLIIEQKIEERTEVFKLVKYMYNIRSKSVHGEIMSVANKLKNPDLEKYFRFKEIVSTVLIKTFGKTEDEIFNVLSLMINSSGDFESYFNIR